MFRMLRTLHSALALVALIAFTASCGSSSGTKFRLVNAIPDSPPQTVDVLIDGKTVESAVSFGSVTPSSSYLAVSSGSRKLEVRPTGQTTDWINSNVSFNGGSDYTIVATGYVSSNTVAAPLLTDNSTAPTSGNAALRIIQASPEGLGSVQNQAVDIYVVAPGGGLGSSPDIPNVAYQAASAYKTLPAGTYDLLLTPAGIPSINITIPSVSFSSGKVYTYVLIDVSGGGAMSQNPVVLNDN